MSLNLELDVRSSKSQTKISKQEPELEYERDQKVDPVIQSEDAGNWFYFRNKLKVRFEIT